MHPYGLGQVAVAQQVGPRGERISTLPYRGVPITVANMNRAVREALAREQSEPIRRLGRQIVAAVRPKDYLSECAAYYYFVLDNLRYLRDGVHVEQVISPLVTLAPEPWDRAAGRRAGQADCAAMTMAISTFLAALLMSTGTRASFITVSLDPKRDEHHVFCIARMANGQRLVLDSVAGPDTTAMLMRVARWREWPVEPVAVAGGWSLGTSGVGPFSGSVIR